MKYPFQVFLERNEEATFWVAKSLSLKGCVGQGTTAEEAVRELEENETEWLETAAQFGIPIPPVPEEQEPEYSGRLSLRVAPNVHRSAARLAKMEGISLNQYINNAVVAMNSSLMARK